MAVSARASECLEEAIFLAADEGATPAEIEAELKYLLENAVEDGVFSG
jgi:hypothetical protein